VLECIFENLDAKRELFREIEALVTPDVILATNTPSSVSPRLPTRAYCRALRGHALVEPRLPHPIVEIIPGEKTTPETVEAATALMREAGKLPVLVKKDAPGFVGNRLLHASTARPMSIVEQGIADPATVDLVLSTGRECASK